MAAKEQEAEGEHLISTLIGAFNRRDADAAASLCAAGGTWQEFPMMRYYPDAASGARGQVEFISSISSDYTFTQTSLYHDGDTLIFEWRLRGTNDGAYEPFAVPASGKCFDLRGAIFVVTEGGKVTHVRTYYDIWSFFAQIGFPQAGPIAWPLEAWMIERQRERPTPIE
jgi:hypothetical protein